MAITGNTIQNSGFESFEFWCPECRPKGKNIAVNISPALDCFSDRNLINGFTRPYIQANAWVASPGDADSTLVLNWAVEKSIKFLVFFLIQIMVIRWNRRKWDTPRM